MTWRLHRRSVLGALLALSLAAGLSALAAPGDKRWELALGRTIYGAPALATNGDLLVTTSEGRLYAVTPAGTVRWSFQTPQNGLGAPTVADDGTIYFGSDKVYALNADGSKRWEFGYREPSTGYTYYWTDPVVGLDGAIYVARHAFDGEQRLFALNPDGTLRWILKARFSAPPVIAEDGTLYLPEGNGSFAAVNPDGVVRWRRQVGNPTLASITPLVGGNVLVPVAGSTILEGAIQALTAAGSNVWRFEAGQEAVSSPIVGPDGAVYCGFNAGRVVALETNGQLRWNYQIERPSSSYPTVWSPALASDGTLFVTGEHWLHALNASGQLLWRFDAGRIDLGAPMIGPDGTVYFGTGGATGILYAVEGTGAPLAASQWPMTRRNTRHQASLANTVTLPAAPTNFAATMDTHTDKVALQWNSVVSATHYQLLRGELPDLAQAVVITNGLTGTNTYEDRTAIASTTYHYFIRATNSVGLGPASGPVQGRRRTAVVGEAVWTLPTQGIINGSPAIGPDGSVFACSSDGFLYAVDASGNFKWSFRFEGSVSGSPSVANDGTIYFSGSTNRSPSFPRYAAWALTPSGHVSWSFPHGSGWASDVTIGADGTSYLAISAHSVASIPQVVAIGTNGSILWSYTNSEGFCSSPIIGFDGRIYASTPNGRVVSLGPDGVLAREFQSVDVGGCLQQILLDDNGAIVAGYPLQVINPDGQTRWRFEDRGMPWCSDPGGVIYTGGDRMIYAFKPDGTVKWSRAVSGQARGGAVGAGGEIYVSLAYGLANSPSLSVYSSDGVKQWDFSKGGAVLGAPTLGSNIVCVGGYDGVIYAVRTATQPAQSPWPQQMHGNARTGRSTWSPPLPSVPSGVSATFRTRVTDVRLSWNSILAASTYEVFRATTTNLADAVLAFEATGQIHFDDSTAVAETAYTYWVKAKNVTGTSPFSAPVTGIRRQAVPGELLYEWNLYGQLDTSPAIAGDGTIYATVNMPTAGATDAGRKVVALRPDGTVRWNYLTGNAMLTSPTIGADGTIYVGIRGALNMFPYPSQLLALNPNGTKRWEIMTDDAIETTPALALDGTIYVGSSIGTLCSITVDGQSMWSTNLGSALASVAVARDKTVYALGYDGRLHAVSPTGSKLWEAQAGPADLTGSLAIAADAAICVARRGGGLKVFHPDGTLRQQLSSNNFSGATPIIGTNDTIVVGAGDGNLYFFDAAGTNVWGTNSGASYWNAAAVSSSGAVYAGNNAGKLFAVSHTAARLWEYLADAALRSSPAIAPDGTIYVGTIGGKLISVFGSGALANTPWPMYQHDAQHTGRDSAAPTLPGVATNVAASDAAFNDRVRVSWNSAPAAGFYEVWRHTQNNSNSAIRLAASVAAQTFYDDKTALPGTNYFYWVRAANGMGTGVFSQTDTGFRRIAVPGEPLGDSRPINATATSPSLGLDGNIYAGGSARFYALNPDLTKAWEFAQGSPSTPAVNSNGLIHAWFSNGRFYALNPNGTQSWHFPGKYSTSLPAALDADGSVIVAATDRTVSCFDPANSGLRWQYLATSAVTASPSVGTDGSVFFGTQDGQLYSLNANGSLRWRYRAGARIQSSPAAGTDGVIYFGSDDRGIHAVAPDGRRRWAVQAGDIVTASPVIAPDGTIIVGSQDRRLYALRPDGTRRWDFLADSAIQSSVCVGADGMIYFGTFNGWVYALNKDGSRVWSFNSATNPVSGGVFNSPLLLENRLLVPFGSSAIQALSVTAGPADINWPQFRRDAQRTARAKTWLGFASPPAPSGTVAGESISFTANFLLPNRSISRLELVAGTNVVATANGTNVVTWSGLAPGVQALSLRAVDDSGNVHLSATSRMEVAAAPRIGIAPVLSGGWRFDFDTLNGRQYQLEVSTNLNRWDPVSGLFTATNSTQVWIETNSAAGAAYYRVRVLP